MTLWLDVTTTLRWTSRPVGIIRVESELARDFMQRSVRRFRFCRYDPMQRRFEEVARADLRRLPFFAEVPISRQERCARRVQILRSLAAGMVARLMAPFARILPLRRLLASDSLTWSRSDTYLSLGLDWDDKDHEVLLSLKRRQGFRVVLCCYDLIPVLLPHLTLASTRDRFPAYLRSLAACADAVLCISRCTKADLQAYLVAERLPQPSLHVFHLGTDLPVAADLQDRPSPKVESLLAAGPFVLMVSTIEARKGHAVLVAAYRRLLAENASDPAARPLPSLLLVGMKGWGVEELMKSVATDPLLQGTIICLPGLSDAELVHLYRHCLFTVFPSLYEGWGLPVAESLAHGKFCLASNRASLPEVGGDFCEYIDAEDEALWAERIRFYCLYHEALAEKERAIHESFQPHSWSQTASEVVDVITRISC